MLKQLRSSSIRKIVVVFQTRMDLLSQPNLDKVIGLLTQHRNPESCFLYAAIFWANLMKWERFGERFGERLSERLGDRLGEKLGERLGERVGERSGER